MINLYESIEKYFETKDECGLVKLSSDLIIAPRADPNIISFFEP